MFLLPESSRLMTGTGLVIDEGHTAWKDRGGREKDMGERRRRRRKKETEREEWMSQPDEGLVPIAPALFSSPITSSLPHFLTSFSRQVSFLSFFFLEGICSCPCCFSNRSTFLHCIMFNRDSPSVGLSYYRPSSASTVSAHPALISVS